MDFYIVSTKLDYTYNITIQGNKTIVGDSNEALYHLNSNFLYT